MTHGEVMSLCGKLYAIMDDPMWADHAEISKATLAKTLQALHAQDRVINALAKYLVKEQEHEIL